VDGIISEVCLGLFGQGYWTLDLNHKREVKSESFEPLISFLAFQV